MTSGPRGGGAFSISERSCLAPAGCVGIRNRLCSAESHLRRTISVLLSSRMSAWRRFAVHDHETGLASRSRLQSEAEYKAKLDLRPSSSTVLVPGHSDLRVAPKSDTGTRPSAAAHALWSVGSHIAPLLAISPRPLGQVQRLPNKPNATLRPIKYSRHVAQTQLRTHYDFRKVLLTCFERLSASKHDHGARVPKSQIENPRCLYSAASA